MREVISNVVVSYQIRPEVLAEHLALIKGVFDELGDTGPENVEYKVLRLDDGVSFLHVSTATTPDGSNPLPELASFQRFAKDLAQRVATPPSPTDAQIVGSYVPSQGALGSNG